MDVLARSDDPARAGTSNPGRTRQVPGGVGRNIAENLARLGTRAILVSRVGDDDLGRRLVEQTRDAGVDVRHVRTGPHPTGTYTAVIDADGELVSAVADMAVVETIDAPTVERELLDQGLVHQAAYLVVDGNLLPEAVQQALDIARHYELPVVLDPVGAAKAERLRPVLEARLPVHTVTPDRAELRGLTGIEDPDRAVAWLHERRVGILWVSEGAQGSELHVGGEATPVPTLPVEAVDVTGAGDALVAAYVHALTRGEPVLQAARFATAAARLTVASPHTVRPGLDEELVRKEMQREVS